MAQRRRRTRKDDSEDIRKKKKAEEAEDEEAEAAQDEDEDDDDDDVFTGKEAQAMLTDPNRPPYPGDYELKVKGFKYFPPDGERPGCHQASFEVIEGPDDEPEDGWPTLRERFLTKFRKGMKLEKNHKQQVQFSKQNTLRFIVACTGELDSNESYSFKDLLKECKGCTVLATAVESGEYMNWRNWRPVDDE